ncbi:LysM peptidoglycan-binding domain-containing protein [Calidifontibacillus oryziterrae]|uniref:LysM peptidoglycan-binding domain-containing protein n=1 Tax=Calidifontibacillus oryziterrae TaxID=1191699 RepID=UPI0002DE5A7B|nr:LysM peptidoglycan-binding domain-containing protein [Calidifontibacillus oryziterrae]
MSSKNQDSFDQAEALRKRMEDNHLIVENKQNEMIDVSKLPPRSEVHRHKEDKKTKIRIRYPIVRFLALVFILIVCFIPIYHLYWENDFEETKSEPLDNSIVDVVEMENTEPVEPEVKDEYEFAPEKDENTPDIFEPKNQIESETPTKELSVNHDDQQGSKRTEETSESVQPADDTSYIIHTVKPGETLYRISMNYFHNRNGEAIIKKANGLDANGTVYSGQKLKIPVTEKK